MEQNSSSLAPKLKKSSFKKWRCDLWFSNGLLVVLCLMSAMAAGQLSRTHFLPPLTNAATNSSIPNDQFIYISTPSVMDVSYTIKPVGQPPSSYITGVVSNANSQEVFLGTGNGQLFIPSSQTSVVINNGGYIIEADGTIYVSLRMIAGGGSQAGALVSKGLTALGNTFRLGSFTNENPQPNYLNFASIMATEDDTQVTISDLPTGLVIENYTGTFPINTTLDRGESYTVATNSAFNTVNRDGLIGGLVTSNKPVVVNSGSANGSFHNGNGRDYGIDQIVDVSRVGREYIFVRGDGNDGWENILIVAHTDNTAISINGNAPIATINAGDYHLIEGNFYSSNNNMYVETSQDVFVYQGVGGGSNEANQGMFFVPPLSCEARGDLDNIAEITQIGNTTYTGGITIATRVGSTISINNTPIANFSTVGPSPVTGNPDYVTYRVSNLSGDVSVQSSDELYCAYFNINGVATSGSFYSGFPSAPEINFETDFTVLGNCIPNVTLRAANTQNFDSFQWLFDDGTGFVDSGFTTPDLTPTVAGTYRLRGVIACSGLILESMDIPVSICPDDSDNDGIIDNIDIDNDNDGILNCTESEGDVVLNIADINTPQLQFQNGSTNTTIVSSTYVESSSAGIANTFTGDNTGNFTSVVNPANDSQGEYMLSFTEPVNFKLSEDQTITHSIVDGEFFIARILPADQNITLVDPDDRLLVDSNFDGIFETGVTMISGSEIRFRINPNPNGTSAYSFMASQVEGFSLIHNLNNLNSASTFRGTVSFTCFRRDTDSDGVADAVDLDSDNDGIPDIIENAGIIVTLSNVDEDQNGLDDVFDINGEPLDSDGDTVFDFYDLDSDNDGITDLIETGQLGLLSDTDLNGIADNGGGNDFGVNGWIDSAESAPDSNQIGYILNDADGDLIFSYIDRDSDGDSCDDVIEAGFSDANGDGFLGDAAVQVDTMADSVTGQGLVTNANDGYTPPNSDVLISAPKLITAQPMDTIGCEEDVIQLTVSSNADSFQWEESRDNGVTWNTLIDDAIYSDVQSSTLTITNTPLMFDGYLYRVRLDRVGNACGLVSDPALLTVNPLPIINSPVELIQCDNDTDGISFFNLTEANQEISADAANQTFTYFTTQAAATVGDSNSPEFIDDPTIFENNTSPFAAVVWARVETTLGCARVSELQLSVAVSQIPPGSIDEMLSQCDDFLDINGLDNANNDDRDGIATFDFSFVQARVESFFLPQTPTVTFYRNEADALSEQNPITDTSNYRNIGYPNSQQIYIRVDSQISNDCQAFGPFITLIVEPLPVANSVSMARECDMDPTDALVNFPFDTSQIESQVLNGQDPADVTITYIDAMGNALPSPLPNPFLTESQTISVRVTNNNTSDPDGPCFDETSIEFIVDQQPIANAVAAIEVCDGDAGDIDNDGIFDFDTSTIEYSILGTQTGFIVNYTYVNESGTVTSQNLPNPLSSGNQTILVEVVNPLNDTCAGTSSFDLVVNPLPEFTIENSQTVCSLDPTVTIVLDPEEENTSESFNYSWVFNNIELATTPTLLVSQAGTYTVTLTQTDGTGCSRSRDVVVNASEAAVITLDDITISDLNTNNTITINDPNSLGAGDYIFSLVSIDDQVVFPFQERSVFENVPAGFYTLLVDDRNGCGLTSIEISVIGYPKFFTPNNDGFNDLWQIEGINELVQPNSDIFIFDRFGKLLKQLSPASAGWDGTFNNNPLPSSDYWFKVNLQDGRVFQGHFSMKR